MFTRQYRPSVYINSVMSNKQKCYFFIVLLLLSLFYQNGDMQLTTFQSGPSQYFSFDDPSRYQPPKSEYSSSNSQSFGNDRKPSSNSGASNSGSSFLTSNPQTGFQSGFGSNFESPGREENNHNVWDYEKTFDNQRGNGKNGPKTDEFSISSVQQPKKKPASQWNRDDNRNWNSGFQGAESKTEGYGGSAFLPSKKTPGNQMNDDSNTYSSGLNFGSSSDSKNTHGFNSNLDWSPGFQNEDSKTEGYGDYQSSSTKKTPGNNWNGNSNNWNSGYSSDKKQGVSQTGTNVWKPDKALKPDGHFPNQFPSQVNTLKPASSGPATNYWNTVSKPDKTTFKKPPKIIGNLPFPTLKPNVPTSNLKPGIKEEKIDWSHLEKENKKGPLVLDLSQLWYPSDGKDSKQTTIKNKKRNISTGHRYDCYCMDYGSCHPERRVDASNVFRSDFHLRAKVAECTAQKKVCCITSPSAVRAIPEKEYELAKYETQGINLRPSCGKRVSKLTANDISEEGFASYGDFPWILRLVTLDENGEGEKNLCSASLIHSSIALTTASCALLLSGEKIRARAGEWNIASGHERNKIQEARIGKIVLHPQFDLVDYANDVALVFLDRAFDSGLGTNSVCLPSSEDVWDSSRCLVAGWIEKDEHVGTRQPALLKIDLATVTRGKCRNNSDSTEYDRNDVGTEDQRYICARARKGDPCLADAGALMCPLYNSNMFVLVGFLSQTGTCNEFYKTGTFTDIMESIDWITHMEGIYLYFNNKQLVH